MLARLTSVAKGWTSDLNCYFPWVDPMTVLYWIHNDKVWKQYVQHRVDEIRKLNDREVWRHCPEKLNLADLPSGASWLQS